MPAFLIQSEFSEVENNDYEGKGESMDDWKRRTRGRRPTGNKNQVRDRGDGRRNKKE